ncbi:protein of unknown function [Marinobacter segnicrescens]|uniref:DUF4168 domain-containing protein n=1 Tax=Marinobacter segnicrescens TaxID=430453 RepID=A0A1I0C8J6_9GAMM|nr:MULTISPECIES: DUF4168 domain-containing protein [Marinobacter]UZD64843.1 DUF4168 domain-containing protein [Marinobacter sp. AN1]SET15138.1 protein of unknown function [Marinobacter segnicrescens]
MKKLLTSATVSIALLAGAPAVYAQTQSQPTETDQSTYTNPAASGEAETDFDDAELRKFVEAQSGINDIRDEYMAKIEDAGSQEEAQELQIEANDEMVSVIEDAGLDIPTYNAIATAYNSEPSVRNRVDALM